MPLPDETPDGAFEIDLAAALDGHAQLVARLDELGDEPLVRLLQHARSTVPYHRTRGPALADFPLTDRDFVRDRVELLSTTHAGEIERLRSNTNGTIARWLTVGFDAAAWYEMFQFSFARIVAARDGLRERLVPGEVGIHYLHDSPSDTRLTSYLPALGGVLLRRWPFGRDGEDVETVRELRAARPPILYAKPTILLRAAELDRALGGERIRPGILATSGAPLYPRDRRALEDWYGCPIINAYVATEAGLIAIECERGTGMHVLEDRVLVEMLGDDGELRDRGPGEVVITNFMNWAQPFIRYRLDDHGVLASSCACGWEGPTLVDFAGRDVAAYDVADGRIATARLAQVLDRTDVKQFEVSQPDVGRLLVRWIPLPGVDPSAIASELERGLRAIAKDHVELRQVERITVVGGKGLRFVRKPWFP